MRVLQSESLVWLYLKGLLVWISFRMNTACEWEHLCWRHLSTWKIKLIICDVYDACMIWDPRARGEICKLCCVWICVWCMIVNVNMSVNVMHGLCSLERVKLLIGKINPSLVVKKWRHCDWENKSLLAIWKWRHRGCWWSSVSLEYPGLGKFFENQDVLLKDLWLLLGDEQ